MADTPSTPSAAQERAAQLLITPGALVQLSRDDAGAVVRYMVPRRIAAGTTFIRAGESEATDYLLLIIDGEVIVESPPPSGSDGLVVSVLGPGSLIGTMGLLDGSPRSATCTASTDLGVALLSRKALSRLIAEEPALAARLLLAFCKHLSDDLRETSRKLATLSQVNRALQQELGATHAVIQRVLGTGGDPAPAPGP